MFALRKIKNNPDSDKKYDVDIALFNTRADAIDYLYTNKLFNARYMDEYYYKSKKSWSEGIHYSIIDLTKTINSGVFVNID